MREAKLQGFQKEMQRRTKSIETLKVINGKLNCYHLGVHESIIDVKGKEACQYIDELAEMKEKIEQKDEFD